MPKANTTLEEILREHLPYELNMLRSTFERLRDGVADGVLRNALIESFSIHARSLIGFFNNEQGVKASSFTDGVHVLFRAGHVDGNVVRKLNTQIAHLTLKRTADPLGKIGDVDRQEMLDTIRLALQEFEQHLKPEFKVLWQYQFESATLRIDPAQAPSPTNAIILSNTQEARRDSPWTATTTSAPTTGVRFIPNTISPQSAIHKKNSSNE